MKIICKIFRHRFNYFITQDIPQRDFRCCRGCGRVQELKELPVYGKSWVYLVQRNGNVPLAL